MHTRRTLKLDAGTRDLTLDSVGRIGLAAGDEATAQNVANEGRLFTNDAYFIQDRGIPYFAMTLGRRAGNAVLRSYLRKAALSVPDVKEIESITIDSFDPETRTLAGDIRFTTVEGSENNSVSTYF